MAATFPGDDPGRGDGEKTKAPQLQEAVQRFLLTPLLACWLTLQEWLGLNVGRPAPEPHVVPLLGVLASRLRRSAKAARSNTASNTGSIPRGWSHRARAPTVTTVRVLCTQ